MLKIKYFLKVVAFPFFIIKVLFCLKGPFNP